MLTANLFPLLVALTPATDDLNQGGGGLTIECPPLVKFFCGESTDPSNTGLPTVTGACDQNIQTTWTDHVVNRLCEAQRFERIIYRTFTVTDGCGNSANCTQQIDVVKKVVSLDLHPRSCPNPFNRCQTSGRYPVALLGSPTFDVTRIDPGSLKLWLQNCSEGPAIPVRFAYQDVTGPYDGGEDCGCTTRGPDGFLDLVFKFERRDVRNELNLNQFPRWSFVRLFVTGTTLDGCKFISSDCIRVQ